jgi:hypothetical protein
MHAYEDALANEDSDVDFDEQAMASPPEEMAMEGCMAPAPSEMDMAVALHHHQGHDQLVTLTQDYLFSHCWEPHRRGAREMASKGGNCRQAMRGHAVRRSGALRQPRPTSMGCH